MDVKLNDCNIIIPVGGWVVVAMNCWYGPSPSLLTAAIPNM